METPEWSYEETPGDKIVLLAGTRMVKFFLMEHKISFLNFLTLCIEKFHWKSSR